MYRLGGRRPSLQTTYSTGLEDITFVIDEIERRQQSRGNDFYGRLDTASIGALGFSIGGALALQATISEPRIDAAANLDGGLNGLTVLTEGAKKPILLVEASNRFPRVLNGPANAGLEEFFSEVERETWQALRLSSQEWYKATILGTEHYHFSDAYLIVPPPEGMLDPVAGHRLVNAIVLEFFHRHLQNRPSPILDHQETLEGVRLTTKLAE